MFHRCIYLLLLANCRRLITACNPWTVTLTANVRTLGSKQLDSIQNHGHSLYGNFILGLNGSTGNGALSSLSSGNRSGYVRSALTEAGYGDARISIETRGKNTALAPRIYR